MTNFAVWLVMQFEIWSKFNDRGGGVLAVWLVINFEYWSKFSGGMDCSWVVKRNAMEVGWGGCFGRFIGDNF